MDTPCEEGKIIIGKAAVHPKGWGEEVWLINTDKYCGKLLRFTKGGAMFSDHYHIEKDETWYVLEGSFEFRYYDLSNADRIIQKLGVGDVVRVTPKTPHQLVALEPGVIVEVSTHHEDSDSYRIGKGDSQKK